MTAEAMARALGGRRVGTGWLARCPAHDDRVPSLSIRDGAEGRVLIRCHAGCPQPEVIEALLARDLWSNALRTGAVRNHDGDDRREIKIRICAMSIWNAGLPITDTPVDAYLRSRGLVLSTPLTVRYHPALKHPSGQFFPAMVALVTRGAENGPVAIHRTFLTPDGSAKARVEPAKMMLGPCRGGAVRLAPAHRTVMVGEGIETCLAAMQATGYPAWAALSTGGLRSLELPAEIGEVIVLADGDGPGEAAAREVGYRLQREGRRVRVARPPAGLDFNDLLLASIAPPSEFKS